MGESKKLGIPVQYYFFTRYGLPYCREHDTRKILFNPYLLLRFLKVTGGDARNAKQVQGKDMTLEYLPNCFFGKPEWLLHLFTFLFHSPVGVYERDAERFVNSDPVAILWYLMGKGKISPRVVRDLVRDEFDAPLQRKLPLPKVDFWCRMQDGRLQEHATNRERRIAAFEMLKVIFREKYGKRATSLPQGVDFDKGV